MRGSSNSVQVGQPRNIMYSKNKQSPALSALNVERKEFDDRTEWHLLGSSILHRDDGPAIVYKESTKKEWYKHGKLHRLGAPAIEARGLERWYEHGVLHREDGPAHLVSSFIDDKKRDILMSWHVNGLYHRIGGPAFLSEQTIAFRQNGQFHNEYGPAAMHLNDKWIYEYFLDGEMLWANDLFGEVNEENKEKVRKIQEHPLNQKIINLVEDGKTFSVKDFLLKDL